MKTLLLLSSIASFAFGVNAKAASINFDTGGAKGHEFVNFAAQRLPIGSLVRLGTLTTAGVASSFVEFATTAINNTGGASAFFGFLRDGVTISTPAQADAIKGKQIYLYVYDTPTATAASGQGLFSSTEWTLPAGFDSASTTTFNVRLGGNSNAVPATAPVVVTALIGTYTSGQIALGNPPQNANGGIYTLTGVPEPSTGILGLAAAIGLLSRRRRTV